MAISRRRIVQAGAGLGVAAAIPAGQHVVWGMKDFTRDDYSPEPPDAPPGEDSWSNWSGIERATPKSLELPESEEALAELVGRSDLRIRPRGSGHSFSGLVPSEGMIVDVSRLSGLQSFDPATGHAAFGAGTRLFQASVELSELGRAFPNLPDIDVQTLAGSFATGTHGTGAELTALHDYIAGFRMVTAAGEIIDVTPEQNAELFAAGKVSLGALGVITRYTLKTIPAFSLHRVVRAEPIEDVLDRLQDLAAQHRNFEIYYLPGTGVAATISHDIHDGAVTGVAESEDDETLAGLKQLRDEFGWWPWLRKKIAHSALPRGVIEDVSAESHKLLSTSRPTKFNEMEYHLPRDEGIAALRKVIAMADRRKNIYFPMEVRFVAPDDAWLSPFNDGPRMSIAMHAAVDEPYDYFFSEFEPVHRAHGGRPHWGKLHSLKKDDLSVLYPDYERFLELRREMDPAGKFLNPHLAELFGEDFND